MTASAPTLAPPPAVPGTLTAAPAVTALMSVYNGEKYLVAAIDSILSQTFTDFEFVIFDDGSKDRSAQILADYARRDSRVRVVTQSNIGLTKTLNRGIALARGRYVARMDCDDLARPERFAKQVAFLEGHPDHVLVGSQVLLIDPDGDPLCTRPQTQFGHAAIDAALLDKGWPLVHPSVMIRIDALRAIGGYDERFRTNQDHDLFLRLSERGPVDNLPDILLHYRQHFSSVVFMTATQQSDVLRAILRDAYIRRGRPMPPEMDLPTGKTCEPTEQYREWFWTALRAGHRKTARKYALRSVRNEPFKSASWKLLFRALAGKRERPRERDATDRRR